MKQGGILFILYPLISFLIWIGSNYLVCGDGEDQILSCENKNYIRYVILFVFLLD